jgi:hypothetical protein
LLITLAGFAAVVQSVDKVFEYAMHQMRRPVTNILTHIPYLKNPTAGSKINPVEVIERNASYLNTIVDLLLPKTFRIDACRLRTLLTPVVGVEGSARTRIAVAWEGIDRLPLVRGDETILREILRNLVENAAWEVNRAKEEDPSRPSPLIEIGAAEVDGFVGLAVRDNGRGIPESIQRKIYDRRFTSKPAGQGTGVGLSFAREAIAKMGGYVDFKTDLNVGTEFWLMCEPAASLAISKDPDSQPQNSKSVYIVWPTAERADVDTSALTKEGYRVTVARDIGSADNLRFAEICILVLGHSSAEEGEALVKTLWNAFVPSDRRERVGSECNRSVPATADGWLEVVQSVTGARSRSGISWGLDQ